MQVACVRKSQRNCWELGELELEVYADPLHGQCRQFLYATIHIQDPRLLSEFAEWLRCMLLINWECLYQITIRWIGHA